MSRLAAVLILALAALPLPAQEDARLNELLQKLDDDRIEIRTAAADVLSKMGASTLPILKRVAASAGPEIRDRLAEIIRKIEDRERLARLLPPPSLITLELKNRPLVEALAEIMKQTPTPIEVGEIPPDARVTVSLKKVPLWKALEAVCKANGKIMVNFDGDHVLITPEPYVALPGRWTDRYRVTLESLQLRSSGAFGQPDRFESFNATVQAAWEKGARPWRVVTQLLELVDESGTDVASVTDEEGALTTSIAPDQIFQNFPVDYPHGPGPQAQRIARLKVGVEFQYPLRFAEVKIDLSPGKVPLSGECSEFSVKLSPLERQDGVLMATLTFTPGANPPDGEPGYDAVILRDKAGKEYLAGVNEGNSPNENELGYILSFTGVPPNAVPAELILRLPTEIHREKLDLELRDVPLK